MINDGFAPAKVNLTLHITGRRDDGYHLLDSLVVFAGVGDRVTATPADALSLEIDGPMSAGLEASADNLVLRAARILDVGQGAALQLNKVLPVASGIGGGSSDAAATIRVLSRLWGLALPDAQNLTALGADVPVCLAAKTCRMRGTGEDLSPVAAMPDLDILLVNPRVEVSTAAVFGGLTSPHNPPMPDVIPSFRNGRELADWLKQRRNDLAAPAMAAAPAIAEVLAVLAATEPLFHAMSGSGATCYALFPRGQAKSAQVRVAKARPDWWCAAAEVL